MSCRQVRQQWSRYHERDLSARTARKLEAHLEQCAACRADWAQFQRAMAALMDATVKEVKIER